MLKTVCAFEKCFVNSINKTYTDRQGHNLQDDTNCILESIDSRILQLKRTGATIIRARALYGSLILDSKSFTLNDFMQSSGKIGLCSALTPNWFDDSSTKNIERMLKWFIGDHFIIVPIISRDAVYEDMLNNNKNYSRDLKEFRISGEKFSESSEDCWLVGQSLKEVNNRLDLLSETIKNDMLE